jgi:CheY-like chemotaxis protein
MATILIAEDNKDIVAVLQRLFTRAGFEVLATHNGDVALQVARRQRPDVVLTDLDMPVLDGLGLCRAIRADLGLCDIPVVILTGGLLPGDPRPREAGACGVLLKPFTTTGMITAVRRLLTVGVHAHRQGATCATIPAVVG